ncbi:protein lifeguard 1 [Corythoichthys intestinalis]|uniref:protein lifeguard 1 n=1 Tax=Corythoichthys intestinalis TaxID=161448 RepID=UPI0025A566F3|nr:protein lifeguard 1 [Corythoichthys intestinalis]XP_061794883.1 protein lifeguard 1-like [Nerophis lumbriciformis]
MSEHGETMFEPSASDMSIQQVPPPPYEEPVQQEPPPYSQDLLNDGEPKGETTGCDVEEGDQSSPETKAEGQSEDPPLAETSAFDDKTVRRAFVRKVFSILTLQLVFTFSVVCVFTFSPVVKRVVQKNIWIYVSSFLIFAIVSIALNCAKSLRRKHPWNLIGLAIVTISLSYVVGTMASYHDTRAVIITMATTLAISLTIIAFSAQTRYEFSCCYGLLLIMVVDLLMFGIFSGFYYLYITQVVYGCLGALLYSLFLMVDCQLMMGVLSYRLDPEEYVTAALMIYLDIMLIFIYLMGKH